MPGLLLQEPEEETGDQEPPEAVPEEKSPLEDFLGISIRGSLSMKYRLRWNWDDSDQDLYQYLSLDIGDPEKAGITGHILLRATADIDGKRDRSRYYVYDDITDSFDENLNGRLYYAYADLQDEWPLEGLPLRLARVGRQSMHETTEPFYFDGIRLDSTAFDDLYGLEAGLYGGVPVHPFESSRDSDYLVGLYAQAEPVKGTRGRFDYTRIRDSYLYGTEGNDLFGLSLWQNVGRYVQAHYRHVFLDQESREHQAWVNAYCPEWDLMVQLSFSQLLDTERELSIDLDSYYFAMREYFPFWQVQLLASKVVSENFAVDAGAQIRELTDDSDDGTFNHEFRHYFLTPRLSGWPLERLGASLSFEFWDVPGTSEGDIMTAGFEVSHRCSENLMASVGTSYSLYEYDHYLENERQNVRIFYLRARYDTWKGIRIEPRYEFENSDYDDDDLNDSHTFWLSVRKDF
ncbi:MAG: hypothetical protein ACYTAF_12805 [Planctomycetota bacterium]